EGRRVIAAGATTTRDPGGCALGGDGGAPGGHSGGTRIFFSPGYWFWVVYWLLTNFLFPRSTFLIVVGCFAGRENVLAAYEHAVREKYRFFSYGDCMLIV